MNTVNSSIKARNEAQRVSQGALRIVVLAMLFNAVLAAVNAHGLRLSSGHVMFCEAAIMLLAVTYSFRNCDNISEHWRSLLFIYVILVLFFWSVLLNQNVYVKSVRDMALMPVFIVLGSLADEKSLIKTMRYLTAALVAFMVLEGWFTDIYVSIFQPAMYYASTRGIQELSTDSSGLFRNSLGFAGRFSFGVFDTHRLSSLLLEQVSLANFSMVLGLFVLTFWDSLRKADRWFFAGAIVFIILTNNTRTGSIVNLLLVIGYFIFPKLPKRTHFLYIPALIALSFLVFYNPHFNESMFTDDMQGRIGMTLYKLTELDFQTIFNGKLNSVNSVLDSGYLYLIYSQTGLGLIAYWIFTCCIVPEADARSKRFVHGLSVFIALNLLIGAGIFTIKVAAPLWFIAGFLIKQASPKSMKETANVGIATRPVRT